jgi:hypothetical protein
MVLCEQRSLEDATDPSQYRLRKISKSLIKNRRSIEQWDYPVR